MSGQGNEGLLQQFISMTNTDPDFARSFLEASNWNFENALNLYLDGGGAAATANVKIASQAPADPVAAATANSLQERIQSIMTQQGVDRATAKAIAEAEGGGSSDGVRAPIAATTGRLIDQRQQFNGVAGGSTFRDFEAETRAMEARIARGEGDGIGTSAAIYQSRRNGHQNANSNQARASNLQDLFSPPREILFQGDFDQARAKARETKRWILINIQKDSVFLSYVFNRDLWSQDVIQDTIKNHFLFFQHEESDAQAARYITFYKPKDFPHIAIVDPLTGEQVKILNISRYQNDPTDLRANFLELLNSFLESNSLDNKVPVAVNNTNVNDNKVENEQKRLKPSTTTQPTPTPPVKDVAYEPLVAEPEANDPDATLIQIRSFDGKRLRRRFKKTDNVGQLFSFVAAEVPEAATRPFDLRCFRVKLNDKKSNTILEQNVINTLISAHWSK